MHYFNKNECIKPYLITTERCFRTLWSTLSFLTKFAMILRTYLSFLKFFGVTLAIEPYAVNERVSWLMGERTACVVSEVPFL